MMGNWKTCTIGDLGTVVGGATPSTKKTENYDGGTISWITPKDLAGFSSRFISRGERNITEQGLKSCSTQLMPAHTVLFSSRAPIGYIAIANQEVCTNQGFKSVVPNEDTDYMFLYYLLKYNKDKIENLGSGTTFKEVSGSTMRGIEVSVPETIEEQRQIASVLSALDDKIEKNTEVNDNLLEQARALFRQWLSYTPGECHCLSEIASINQETYSPKGDWDIINYLDTSSITDGKISEIQQIKSSVDKLPSRARRILKQGDIVFSTVRPNQLHYGIVSYPLPNMLGSTGFAVIRSNVSTIPNEIIYLALTEPSFIEQMQQIAEQSVSTFPSIRPSDLDACRVPIPQESEIEVIATIKSLFAKNAANNEENIRLSLLRDTLLPRLMSGEIDISALDI